MKAIRILGTAGKKELSSYLLAWLPGGWEISYSPAGDLALTALFIEAPLDALEPGEWPAGSTVDIVLVEWGERFAQESELGLERSLKSRTGAGKVLIFRGVKARERAFQKVCDLALSMTGGATMPEEVPENVMEAVKKEAVDNRIECERAQQLAGELGVPIPVVGRALDLLGIKITSCQLGCF